MAIQEELFLLMYQTSLHITFSLACFERDWLVYFLFFTMLVILNNNCSYQDMAEFLKADAYSCPLYANRVFLYVCNLCLKGEVIKAVCCGFL